MFILSLGVGKTLISFNQRSDNLLAFHSYLFSIFTWAIGQPVAQVGNS